MANEFGVVMGSAVRKSGSRKYSCLCIEISGSSQLLSVLSVSYAFGLFSDTLKDDLGFSQRNTDIIASVGELGLWSTFGVGAVCAADSRSHDTAKMWGYLLLAWIPIQVM